MNKTIKSFLIIFFFLQLNLVTQAQENNTTKYSSSKITETEAFHLLLDEKPSFDPENDKMLQVGINSSVFTRNAEYFLPYTKGYTLLGFYLQPTLIYQINDRAKIQAGVHLMGIAGHDGLRKIAPIMRIEYQPVKWLTIIGGSLYGNLNHKLYEPMYDFDRYFYANTENGLQILTKTKHWEADIWCNWENFLEPGEFEQEKFTFGMQNRFHLLPNSRMEKQRFELSIPVHLLATHRGGQFSALQDTCIETLANGMVGVTSSANLAETNFIKKITFDISAFGFLNNSGHVHTHFDEGWGLYPQLTLQSKSWKLQTGYWHADRYVAPRGSYLFQSVSYFDTEFEQVKRDMITAKLFFEHHYKGLGFGIESQVYYDIDHNKTDFAFGIYLRFNDNFNIVRIAK